MRMGWTNEAGFLDSQGIEPGDAWPATLEEALSTARAFVPVLSPTYFAQLYCGREWAAFVHRIAQTGNSMPLIHPVLLVPSADLAPMPRAAADIQYAHDDFPEAYRMHALSYLAGVPGEGDSYTRFYKTFATKLIEAARANELERSAVPALRSLDSAFHQRGTEIQDIAPDAQPGKRLFVRFIYAAARRQEFGALGEQLVFHGEEGGLDLAAVHAGARRRGQHAGD